MPYMFLWSGFVLRGQDFVNQHTTHLTDSSIENFFYARKRMFPEAVAPARYILGTSYITLGQCNNDYNPTVDTSDDSSEATQTEESTRTAVDMWKPKRAKIGIYQAPQITLRQFDANNVIRNEEMRVSARASNIIDNGRITAFKIVGDTNTNVAKKVTSKILITKRPMKRKN